jgi:hypothetical protein
VQIVKGVMVTTTRFREALTYHVKNRSETDRTVLVEHPFRSEYRLVSKDEPKERARDVYRFELKVGSGKDAKQEVVEERDVRQDVAISNSDEGQIRFFLSQAVLSAKVKEALGQALTRKLKLGAAQSELAAVEAELKRIGDDQTRLRENLKAMPQTAAAYQRYLKKFDDQETDIEKLQDKVKQLRDAEARQRQELDHFLANLSAE